MKCQKCGSDIEASESMEIQGQTVCEDCYIDIAAKPKTCDPWAVYSAKNIPSSSFELNENQAAIIEYLKRHGPTPPETLAADLGLSMDAFEREMAPLRHMEKVRAQLREGQKEICLW